MVLSGKGRGCSREVTWVQELWRERWSRAASRGPGPGLRLEVHSAIDGFSRLAYSEVLADELGASAAAFRPRARRFFAVNGITVERVLTDNGACLCAISEARVRNQIADCGIR